MEILGLVVIVILVVLGVPMWAGVMTGATISLVFGYGIDPLNITALLYDKVHVNTLLAVPLFILAGELLNRGGATRPLLEFLTKVMGHIPGGPAYAVIVACAVIAAMCSGGMAAVAGFGPIVVPMMTSMGYSKKFSIGLLVCAASLGGTIPPSIPLIIFGYLTETSVKDLYAAAIIPGVLLATLLAVTVFIHTKRGHFESPPPASWQERWEAFVKAVPMLLLPLFVLVPIYTGWDTVTEAASVAVVYSLFLGTVVYRQLKIPQLWEACKRASQVTSVIFVLLTGAMMLNLVLAYMRVPYDLGDAIVNAGFSTAVFLLVVIGIYLFMGAVLDPTAILMIMSPILMPAVLDLGINPVMFGVLVAISVEIAVITPPFGITLFTASSVLKEEFGFVARSCLMFYPAMIIGQLLIAFIPAISLSLPGL